MVDAQFYMIQIVRNIILIPCKNVSTICLEPFMLFAIYDWLIKYID